MRGLVQRGICLALSAALIAGIAWLDRNRGGPASTLSRCNLSLSRADLPAADILLVGSSRTGTALDPVALEAMLAHGRVGTAPSVERIALAHNPLRASYGLLENYLERRGAPKLVVLELMLETELTVDRLDQRGLAVSAEEYIFRRDLNLLRFGQISGLPAVAMPFTEAESGLALWRYRLRGIVLRAGALAYEYLRQPNLDWDLDSCGPDDWVREPEWPEDFRFSHGELEAAMPPAEVIDAMEAEMTAQAQRRVLKPWQDGVVSEPYSYELSAAYRRGEMSLLAAIVELLTRHEAGVVLLPLPAYGQSLSSQDLSDLRERFAGDAELLDLYGRINGDLDKFWYDEAHIEPYPAGVLTTALLAEYSLSRHLRGAELAVR